jgi:hypothetical protein
MSKRASRISVATSYGASSDGQYDEDLEEEQARRDAIENAIIVTADQEGHIRVYRASLSFSMLSS